MARRLVREEGLFCGGSSGGNVHIALEIARELGPDKVVVTILPDSGTRYITKHLSDAWMKDNGFLAPADLVGRVKDVLSHDAHEVSTVHGSDPISKAIDIMRAQSVSQIPVLDKDNRPHAVVHEVDVLKKITFEGVAVDEPVIRIANPARGFISPQDSLSALYDILEEDHAAIVLDGDKLCGILTKIDLINYLTRSVGV